MRLSEGEVLKDLTHGRMPLGSSLSFLAYDGLAVSLRVILAIKGTHSQYVVILIHEERRWCGWLEIKSVL